jgi:hypothetical protein
MNRETKRVIRDTAIILSIVIAFLLTIHGCESKAAVLSPRQASVAKTTGKPMAQSQAIPVPGAASNPVVVLPTIIWGGDTNNGGYTIGLAWDPSPSTNVIGYNVYYGVASRVYTNMFTVGMATNCGVMLDFGSEYYFAVTAFSLIAESDDSSEVTWGEWLPDRVTVTWPTNPPCALLISSVFSQPRSLWTVAQAKPSSGTITVMLGPGARGFFCLQGSTNRLTIKAWNPLNQ